MVWTRAAGGLARSRLPGAPRLAAGLDVLGATGIRYGWQRAREHRRWTGVRTAARDGAYRAIWEQAAAEVGVAVRVLPGGMIQLELESGPVLFAQARPPLDQSAAWDLAGDKPRQRALLEIEGIATPEYREFDAGDVEAAVRFMGAVGGPCVVKPALDTGAGSGVTSGIRTRDDLGRAVRRASQTRTRLLIERQAQGSDYRILVLNGEVVDIVQRRSPTLVGNGRSTVARLIAAENERRLAGDDFDRLRMLTADLDSAFALREQGLTVRSSPAAGRRVTVKGVVNQNAVGENETIRTRISTEGRSLLANVARAAGLRLAGIDLMTPDLHRFPRIPGVVLEVNPHPGIHHHYAVAERQRATPVAAPILRALIANDRPDE